MCQIFKLQGYRLIFLYWSFLFCHVYLLLFYLCLIFCKKACKGFIYKLHSYYIYSTSSHSFSTVCLISLSFGIHSRLSDSQLCFCKLVISPCNSPPHSPSLFHSL